MYNMSSGRTKRPGHTANKQVDDEDIERRPIQSTSNKNPSTPLIFYPNLNEQKQ